MSSWFGEGLSNLKGQITNFTKEVLAEATAEEAVDGSSPQTQVEQLEALCSSKDAEIARLQQRAQELEARLKLPQAVTAASEDTAHHPAALNLQPHLAGASSAGSVEEEQDGWSQFSEEDFPCLTAPDQGGEAVLVGSPPAADGTQRVPLHGDSVEADLRVRLRDAESRIRELEAAAGPQSARRRSCLQFVDQALQLDPKGAEHERALHSLVAELGGEPLDREVRQRLEQRCSDLQTSLTRSEAAVVDWQSQLESVKNENAALTRSLEELDEQHQAAIDRVLGLKDSLQQERDSLATQLASCVSSEELQEQLIVLEGELLGALRQALPPAVAQEVGEAESMTAMVRAVGRECGELLWRKEASERKLAESTREARELRQELTSAKSEGTRLREHAERLMAQLSVAAPSSSGALEPIPEEIPEDGDGPGEESTTESAPQSATEALQLEAEALREVRVNLEAEVTSLRSETQGLEGQVRSLRAQLHNQENLVLEATVVQESLTETRQQLQQAQSHGEGLGRQLQESQAQVSALQNRLASSEGAGMEALTASQALQSELSEQVRALSRQLEERASQLQAREREVEELSRRLEDLEQAGVFRQQEQTERATKEVEEARHEVQSLTEELRASKEEAQGLSEQLRGEVEERNRVTQKLEEQNQVLLTSSNNAQIIEAFSHQVAVLTQEKENLQREIEGMRETLQESQIEISRERAALEKDLQDKLRLGIECERLQLEVDNALQEKTLLELTVKEMGQAYRALDDGKEGAMESLETERRVCEELRSKVVALEGSLEAAVLRAGELEGEMARLQVEAEGAGVKDEELQRLTAEVAEWRTQATNMEESYQMTSRGYQEIVRAMEAKEKVVHRAEAELDKMAAELGTLTETLNLKCVECSDLQARLEEQAAASSGELERRVDELRDKVDQVEQQKLELQSVSEEQRRQLAEREGELETERNKIRSISEELNKLQSENCRLIEDNNKLRAELASTDDKLSSAIVEVSSEQTSLLAELRSQVDVLNKEKGELEAQVTATREQQLSGESTVEQVQTLQAERASMLGVLDEKTRENSSLRAENHRLVALVASEKAASQQLLQEKTELLSRKQFQSAEASEMARESVASLAKMIRDKDNELESLKTKNQSLMTLLQDSNPGLAIHQLFSSHPDAERLRGEVGSLQEERAQLVHSLQVKHHESLQYHAEVQRLSAALVALQDQQHRHQGPEGVAAPPSVAAQGPNVEHLIQSLSQEQQRNKFLQNEVQELSEKEAGLQTELGRLRQHLVTVEEQYTEEALRSEQAAQELRSQLAAAEERARNTVTSLSSASARAGQQVELLQEQARVAAAQRDEALRRLAIAEDEARHNTMALRNLQTVLEQFQQDKDREIELASERLRQQLRAAEQRSEQHLSDMRALQGQLQEAKEGLNAAARLGVQMDKKSDQISSLKEEVVKLGEQLHQAQEQINSASHSMEGKVDKYLIKNLIVGYFMTAPNNRLEALRIVATVLDFSGEERARVGLEPGGPPRRGSGVRGGPQVQSLAEAFIQFLEKESRPVPQVRMLEEAVNRPRKTSAPGPGRSPLLMNEMVLPSFAPVPTVPSGGPGAPSSSSSSALKDVLRES